MDKKENDQLNVSHFINEIQLPLVLNHLEPVESVKMVRSTPQGETKNAFYGVRVFRGEKFYKPISKI